MVEQSAQDGISESIRVAVKSAELPDRKYFKIGEVSQIVGVEPHVLRYWQTQFPQVRPQKSRSGHRLYRRRDVETLLGIRELLHVQRFTIAGAKQALKSLRSNKSEQKPDVKRARKSTLQKSTSKRPQRHVEISALDVVGLKNEELEVNMEAQLADQVGADAELSVHEGSHPTPSSVSREAKFMRENQLGFGFDESALAKLSSARDELESLLDFLDTPRV